MASNPKSAASAMEIDRLATQLAKDPQSKAFLPLAEEYCKVGMWEEAVAVLEDGLKYYPGFITAMVALGRAYDQLNQPTKARAVLEAAVKLSPENLRAHRTLIKIYKSQGLTEEAHKSCRVILAMNPRDEEALSVQASLGAPAPSEPANPLQAQKSTPASPSSAASLSVADQTMAVQAAPETAAEERLRNDEGPVDARALPTGTALDLVEPAPQENNGSHHAEGVMAVPRAEDPDSTPASSPHAATIAQLESWLRSIEQRRRDRAIPGDPNS